MVSETQSDSDSCSIDEIGEQNVDEIRSQPVIAKKSDSKSQQQEGAPKRQRIMEHLYSSDIRKKWLDSREITKEVQQMDIGCVTPPSTADLFAANATTTAGAKGTPIAENLKRFPVSAPAPAPALASSPAGASVPKTSLLLPRASREHVRERAYLRELKVQWRGYKCSSRSVRYLDLIFHKHPKTFDGFRVKSANFQVMFLDALADLVKSLAEKKISQITTDDINETGVLMMDLKSSAGLDISWLEQRYKDATAILAVHGLKQESARVSSELQQTDKSALDLRRNLAAEEAKAASLRARCEELDQKISFQKTLIDPTRCSLISCEDQVLKDLWTDHSEATRPRISCEDQVLKDLRTYQSEATRKMVEAMQEHQQQQQQQQPFLLFDWGAYES